MSYSGFSLI